MITVICSKTLNDVIGINGDLVYRDKVDMQRFKHYTEGSTIVMGRRTFESLPKVLPNRIHHVITHDADLKLPSESCKHSSDILIDQAYCFTSLSNAIFDSKTKDVYVIGGEQIFSEGLLYADRILLTKINFIVRIRDTDDVKRFPKINHLIWEEKQTTWDGKEFEEPWKHRGDFVSYVAYTRCSTL